MNIGPILRGMIGESKPGTPKTLDLKAGQVVRGTVLSVSEDGQEAVIQVQGVKLHATLETPLKEGQTTLLQVQPQMEDGVLMLKPIQTTPAGTMSAASLASALETMGLENTPENRDLLQLMQTNGIPLTKENVTKLLSLNSLKPPETPLAEWIHAAGIAINRALPLTGETVRGLQQAVFGPPLHTLLSALEEQLGQWFGQVASTEAGLPAGKDAAGTAWDGKGGIPAGRTAEPSGPEAKALLGKAPQAEGAVRATGGGIPGAQAAAAEPEPPAAMMSQGANVKPESGLPPQLLQKLQAVLSEVKAAVLLEGTAAGSASPPAAGTAGTGAAGGQQPLAGAAAAAGEPAAAAVPGEGPAGPSPQQRPTPPAEPWVGRVLKLLGAEHEQQVLRAGASGEPAASAAPSPAGAAPGGVQQAAPGQPGLAGPAAAAIAAEIGAGPQESAPAHPAGAAALPGAAAQEAPDAASASARDTLKSLLLQVAAADDLPAPLQETARQIVQQLTGQQLLLTTDRTAPFAQVTMFLPFIGPDGEQTAAVHIESRRGRKGELDADNCRLWFDLQMKALGQLMVDVQVADKKVLLKIYSERDIAGVFLESRQQEIEAALDAAGYRLLSLKAEPLIPSGETGEKPGHELAPSLSYAPSPYKGVDYRV
ncbi:MULTISPECIES: flagellar hook-length control protein FliK [Paenibacillus]|uniref:flagellar hook-length control protein FliK n=1 Tax=Paenibacillus TaxID=44249 RepID=UPI002FDFE5F5